MLKVFRLKLFSNCVGHPQRVIDDNEDTSVLLVPLRDFFVYSESRHYFLAQIVMLLQELKALFTTAPFLCFKVKLMSLLESLFIILIFKAVFLYWLLNRKQRFKVGHHLHNKRRLDIFSDPTWLGHIRKYSLQILNCLLSCQLVIDSLDV